MKKWSLLLVGMLSVGLFSSVGFAYNPAKEHARQAYRTTARVLMEAQDAARMGHDYQGLGRAFAHQRLSRDYYYTRNFRISIQHSLRARQIAYNVIENNSYRMEHWKKRKRHGYGAGNGKRFDDFEMRYTSNMSPDDLDARVSRNNNNNDDNEDEVSLKVRINFNL